MFTTLIPSKSSSTFRCLWLERCCLLGLSRFLIILDLEKNTEDIQRFLDEIARLREQLLEANQTILQLRIDNPVNSING